MASRSVPTRRRRTRIAVLATIGTAAGALAACSSDEPVHTEAAYCAAARDHLDLLSAQPTELGEVSKILAAYRAMHAAAPLAIEQEWKVMVDLVDAAAHVDATQSDELGKVAEAMRRARRTAAAVIVYTRDRCDVLIGPPGFVPETTVVPPTLDAAAKRRTATTAAPVPRPPTTPPPSTLPGGAPAGSVPEVTTHD